MTSNTIVDAVVATPQLSTLKEAVLAAGLADTLKSAGPFTVFAPTDQAFAATLHRLGLTAAQLLADKTLLTDVLKTHVVAGVVTSTDLVNAGVTTVKAINNTDQLHRAYLAKATPQGVYLEWHSSASKTGPSLQMAQVVKADIKVANGIVHIINNVIV